MAAIEPHLVAQEVSTAAPPPAVLHELVPDGPGAARYPDAQVVPVSEQGTTASVESDTQQRVGSHYIADGHVVIKYQTRTVEADRIDYDDDTGDVVATGHLLVTGGENDERIQASHGTLNIQTGTGRFYDVSGSVGIKASGPRLVYANGNPFLFTGKIVVKTGPQNYEVYQGTLTSCGLAHPDWLLSTAKFTMDGEKARGTNSVFHLLNVPILWLPYVTHPVDSEDRQSGILIPVLGDSSSKGLTFGEQVYWAVDRSTDLTVGTIYYSDRGWAQTVSFRHRGLGQDMLKAHYSGLQDRGYLSGGTILNQSGQDVTYSQRHDFSPDASGGQTRLVAEVEYLSSFVYREGFTDNFNQAVSSDVLSTVYATHEWNGYAASVEADRYQGEKRVASQVLPEQQVRIFHAPSLEFAATDHRLGSTGLEWSLDSSATGLKRVQPNFTTSGIVERLDMHPELAYPLSLDGWRVRPAIGVRETFYSRSRLTGVPSPVPLESQATLNRADLQIDVDVRPPVMERTFDSGIVKKLLRHDVKHTIEPDLTYRYIAGIGDFQRTLRFDAVDIASDTNELEYGVTQRLFVRRPPNAGCQAVGAGADASQMLGPDREEVEGEAHGGGEIDETGAPAKVCSNREWISWRVSQKFFFDPAFGGAVTNGRRNILDTTLNLSGIAFLTEQRDISPLISRLRVRTSAKTDIEWDFDFDTGARKFTANNIFVDVHQGDVFGGVSFARLNAPGRSYVAGVASAVAEFSQMRVLMGFGRPTKAGLSLTANAGIDLDLATVQYGAVQASYNWNCCGLSVEYRKYELGTARNENAYRFNFTLANIGTAGNIRHANPVY